MDAGSEREEQNLCARYLSLYEKLHTGMSTGFHFHMSMWKFFYHFLPIHARSHFNSAMQKLAMSGSSVYILHEFIL